MQFVFTLPLAALLLPAPAFAPDQASWTARFPFHGLRLHRKA